MFNLGDFSMKKTLVALAALASVSAFAQSTVTLYGRMDLGTSSVTTTSGNAAGVIAKTKATSLAGAQSSLTGMRLGVRGTEDLGGGLTANFVWETAIQPDEAVSVGNTRLGNLSLQGGFGRVTIGTYDNSIDTVRAYNQAIGGAPGSDTLVNFFNSSAAGAAAAPFASLSVGNPIGLRGRSQNSIAYSTAIGGFTFGIGTTNEKNQTVNAAGNPTALAKTSGYMLGVGYANGPLATNFAYGSAKSDVLAATRNVGKIKDWGFAVSYDLGIAKPWFQYESGKLSGVRVAAAAPWVTTAVNGSASANAWTIGTTIPLGNLVPFVAVGRGSAKDNVGFALNAPADTFKASSVQVGARYSLSKRTTTYVAFGNDKIRDTNNGFTGYSKRSGFVAGVRHDF
jgi:predicted porin